ncbi:MAG: hypothetical protein JWR84_624 [Caulobacter sp.]|nr:hypothetical protein [Caulobacter sp.]
MEVGLGRLGLDVQPFGQAQQIGAVGENLSLAQLVTELIGISGPAEKPEKGGHAENTGVLPSLQTRIGARLWPELFPHQTRSDA